MEYYREHKKGLVGTIVFHVIVLILLILLGFFTPLPLPGEEGILVNFGTSDNGFGEREPSPARKQQPAPAQPEEKKETPPPATQQPATTPPPKPEPEPAEEVAMTQDFEETAAIDAAEKKKKEEERIRQEQIEEEQRQKRLEDERLRKIEEERLQKIKEEQDRIAREKAAEEARLEAERKAAEEARLEAERKAAEEQRRISEINSRAQGAFSKSGSGSGGEGNSDGKSQGATFPGGNQGVPTGDPNAGNYGQGGSGSGDSGSGVSFSLSGRSATNLAKPRYPGNDAGVVVVKVTVDKYGKVTSAEPGARGTTIMNQAFWAEAKSAALKTKFNSDDNAPAFQQGTITYRFVLD